MFIGLCGCLTFFKTLPMFGKISTLWFLLPFPSLFCSWEAGMRLRLCQLEVTTCRRLGLQTPGWGWWGGVEDMPSPFSSKSGEWWGGRCPAPQVGGQPSGGHSLELSHCVVCVCFLLCSLYAWLSVSLTGSITFFFFFLLKYICCTILCKLQVYSIVIHNF